MKKIRKTKFRKAFENFAESEEGKKCFDGITYGEYLKNRLHIAFSAGWIAGQKNPND